jgi:hypothetical protein
MTLNQVRMRLLSIACVVAMASLLGGCGASGAAASTAAGGVSTVGTGSGESSAPATIMGIDTPKSVSVVTAN